jgi:DNA-directed RNA polymerase beta subunit
LKFVNPFYKVDADENIFNMRGKEYECLLQNVKDILKPAVEAGFSILELDLKESKFSSGELQKTKKKNLIIRLQKGTSEINLSMFIPQLIKDNYIQINGRQKIAYFQLFDIPIVTRGENIKLRTNVATLMLLEEKEPPLIRISFLGKKVPLAILMFAFFGPEALNERYDFNAMEIDEDRIQKLIETKQKKTSQELYEILLSELKMTYEADRSYTQDDYIMAVGRTYSKHIAKSKGEDIVYALDLIPKVDILSTKFFHTKTVLDELLWAMENSPVDDTLLTNKRIRVFEYMILMKVMAAVFNLCISTRTARQPKFNVNSTQILSDCNVSDIVQFDFSINPIEELTRLSRVSLLGPGGFKRENVPKHLRDITPSMLGRLCPVDTPDRENCGIVQNLLPNVKVDENLRFTDETLLNQPTSIPVSMVPFLEHDDQTRLQMSASQMRQAILMKYFDIPLIQSGCEGLYTDQTQFIKIAKKDGEVIYINNEYIFVMYNDKEFEIFDRSWRKIYVSNMDFMKVYVSIGDKFKKGDILAESNFCKDGNINIGKNLLTAIMPYYGSNYEDGIVISDRLIKDEVFTSVHFEDLSFMLPSNKVLLSLSKQKYKPLPEAEDIILKNKPFAIIKELFDNEQYSLFKEAIHLTTTESIRIIETNVYANTWNTDIPEFNEWIEKKTEEQEKKQLAFQEILEQHLPKEKVLSLVRNYSLDKFSFAGKYKIKKERIPGVYVEMFGIFYRPIKVGDKIANRHGNKGVISRIVEHEKMPKIEDGRHVDICINPLGIISRMNIGQLFEAHLAMSVQDLKFHLIAMLRAGSTQEALKHHLKRYIKIIDNTKGGWYYTQFKDQLSEEITEDFIRSFSVIQPPFESVTVEQLIQALNYTNTKFEQVVYDPISKTNLFNPITVGSLYFFRMVHIAEERLSARGIGAYTRRTLQPLGGRRNKGGQRMGEMETACIIAHDAPENLFEFLTTKSDCIELKNRHIQNIIEPQLVDKLQTVDIKPESVKLLNAYLTVIGVDQKGV